MKSKFIVRADETVMLVNMTRAEFLKMYPREPIRVFGGGHLQLIDVPEDAVCCDACNGDVDDSITVVDASWAYCSACASRMGFQFEKEEPGNGNNNI